MLTASSLASDCGLELLSGIEGGARPLRWIHISEQEDPTPWLSGGELLLTTGPNLETEAKQRDYVERLKRKGVAGLGFGTGFDHERVPEALLGAAGKLGLPVFEVPYEMPFIAITERAAARLINEQYDVLERGSQVHERLERLVIEGGGLDEITAAIAGALPGAALVFDGSGGQVARHPSRGLPSVEQARAIGAELSGRGGGDAAQTFQPAAFADRGLAVPIPAPRRTPPAGWLVVLVEHGPLGDFERLIARQASIVVGLELMRERVVRETERRLAGDLLADALSGRLDAEELAGRLRPFGVASEAAVLVFDLDDPPAAESVLAAALGEAGVPALVATSSAAGRPLLCAVIDGGARDPVAVGRKARAALVGLYPGLRAAASRSVGLGSLRRAFHEARCALEAAGVRRSPGGAKPSPGVVEPADVNGGGPEVASHRDLGAFTLLLALQDDEALRLYSDDLLEPIQRGEGEYGGELLRSLEGFIENNGNWERAARQLYCHRHTLRYRIRKIEELTGRDLSRATDRIELWLALRARELVR